MNNFKITEQLHHLANSEFAELDEAIAYLSAARRARAVLRACVAFKDGDLVTFQWLDKTLSGTFVGVCREDNSKVQIRPTSDSGTYLVDAAKVDHATSLEAKIDDKPVLPGKGLAWR